jgi:hypothetical protein
MRAISSLLVFAGAALGVLAYEVQINDLQNNTQGRAIASVVAAWSFLLAGIVA